MKISEKIFSSAVILVTAILIFDAWIFYFFTVPKLIQFAEVRGVTITYIPHFRGIIPLFIALILISTVIINFKNKRIRPLSTIIQIVCLLAVICVNYEVFFVVIPLGAWGTFLLIKSHQQTHTGPFRIKTLTAGLLASSALAIYIFAYYGIVQPVGPSIPAGKPYPEVIYKWRASYEYAGYPSWDSPLQKILPILFKPAHMIDRIIRKDTWTTPEGRIQEMLRATEPKTVFTYGMASVGKLSTPLQNRNYKKADYIWNYDNGLHCHSFTNCMTTDWESNYSTISNILVCKAEQQELDTDSLRKALNLIRRHSEKRIAYLPISAHQAEFNKRQVWVIEVLWEYPSDEAAHSLGHVRNFVYDQNTLELVEYSTCM